MGNAYNGTYGCNAKISRSAKQLSVSTDFSDTIPRFNDDSVLVGEVRRMPII